MSLATRCSSCGTVFRVVQDQLKVSEGWVRCGRCNEVFNALEGLFDLDREAPPEWEPGEREEWAAQAAAAPPVPVQPADLEVETVEDDPHLVDKIDSELFGEQVALRRSARAAAREPSWLGNAGTASGGIDDAGSEPLAPLVVDRDDELQDKLAPDFLRKAEREARWARPWVRSALGAGALVLLVTLALQAGHHFRDDVAARWPEAAPILASWCAMADCTIGAPKHIEEVAVESTALSRVGTTDAYRLSLSLRNRAGMAVALPSIDLALTDVSGQLIARRALSARDFPSAPERIPPGGEAVLQTVLTAGSARITGYTVEAFYP